MARYRKIDTRMWADAKFRALSSPPPTGKYLWIALLTGPYTTNLPGLFRVGEMALAEELGWTLEGFRKAFVELFREGLAKADWNARVVWIPNAIKYNPPDNPNVVKGWRDSWDEVPECALKAEAYQTLRTFTKGLGEGFGKAFAEGCVQCLANQEQEQEQEQEQISSSEPQTGSDVVSTSAKENKSKPPSHEACKLATLLKAEIRNNKADYRITQAQERNWEATADVMLRRDGRSYEEIAELIRWAQGDDFWRVNILSMDTLRKKFDQLALKRDAAKSSGRNGVSPVIRVEGSALENERNFLAEAGVMIR
jgi:hypothetical protein